MPVILKVENTSDVVQKDIELFDCLRKLKYSLGAPYRWMPTRQGIEILSCIPGIGYEDIVLSIATGTEIEVDRTTMKYSYEVEKSLSIVKMGDIFGTSVVVQLSRDYRKTDGEIPITDNRDDKRVVQIDLMYPIDKTTSFQIDELQPNSSVKIWFVKDAIPAIKWMYPEVKPGMGKDVIVDDGEGLHTGKLNDDGDGVIISQDEPPYTIEWINVIRWAYAEEKHGTEIWV